MRCKSPCEFRSVEVQLRLDWAEALQVGENVLIQKGAMVISGTGYYILNYRDVLYWREVTRDFAHIYYHESL